MKRRLAYLYLIMFFLFLSFGAVYNMKGEHSFSQLFSKRSLELSPAPPSLNGQFMSVGGDLGENKIPAFHPLSMPHAQRDTEVVPHIPARCFFTEAELESMNDAEANRIVNEAVNFLELPPSGILELEEVNNLSPEDNIRKQLHSSEGQLKLKTAYVNCVIDRLLPFGDFAEIARPVLVDLLAAPLHRESARRVLERMKNPAKP